ncbi:MAG: amidohydrolase family protein [Clostridiales bacterium]|nr:amidohydrolase family protein [Clostridiales bacterium]
MVIDFHTHIFPEKIADRALGKLAAVIGIPPGMNGTSQGLRESMDAAGVDVSVVLPVVTDPHQFDSILRFASRVNEESARGKGPKLLSLAGIHPDSPDPKEKLRQIAREGFQGIKLHPNYQGVVFDDIRYKRIIYDASELGLLVLTHAGYDPYTPGEVYCSPEMILHVLREVCPPKLVAAHMGSNENYEESEEKLCGEGLYMDTAYSLMHMSGEQFVRMVRKHGADRVLFGTDAPWTIQKAGVERLRGMEGLSAQEKEQILWKNAAALLGI